MERLESPDLSKAANDKKFKIVLKQQPKNSFAYQENTAGFSIKIISWFLRKRIKEY